MQKIMNRTLGGKIVETSSMRNQYNEEIYHCTLNGYLTGCHLY